MKIEFEKLFDKEKKLKLKQEKLDKKFDKLYKKKSRIAYQLYLEFMKNGLSNLNTSDTYYNVYIEDSYLMAEELCFLNRYDSLIEFQHKSPFRQNHRVNLNIGIEEDSYETNRAVIDKTQFSRLSKIIKITVRK